MNRVIEFRVWDKVNKVMIYPEIIGVGMENFAWAHSRSYLHNCTDWDSEKGFVADPIYMQFIGLLDKNGKKIFEGDIVESKSHNPSKYIVNFIEGGFCMVNSQVSYPTDINHFYPSVGTDLNIIGNLYENQNLCN
jgi:uncharacterized phage protein (TIGR01671 family)